MATTGYEAFRGAVHAALHGLIEGLADPPPVIKEGAAVQHHLQLPTGEGGAPLRPVCQHPQLCLACVLHKVRDLAAALHKSDGFDCFPTQRDKFNCCPAQCENLNCFFAHREGFSCCPVDSKEHSCCGS